MNGITAAHIASDDADLRTISSSFRCKLIDFSEFKKSGKAGSIGGIQPEFTQQVTAAVWAQVAADMADHPSQIFVALRRPHFCRGAGYPNALLFAAHFIALALPGPMHWNKCMGKRLNRTLLRQGWDNTVTTGTGTGAVVERPGVVAYLKVRHQLHGSAMVVTLLCMLNVVYRPVLYVLTYSAGLCSPSPSKLAVDVVAMRSHCVSLCGSLADASTITITAYHGCAAQR
jgi:hypothetical protein